MSNEELSDIFNVSNRTISSDIKSIDNFFKSIDVPLISKNANDRWCVNNDLSYNSILSNLDLYEYSLSQNERIKIEAIVLILSPDNITYADLSEIIFSSRSTVISDQPKLSKLLEKYNLEFVGESGVGLNISGQEVDIRDFIIDILKDNIYLRLIFINTKTVRNTLHSSNINELIDIISNCLGDIEYRNELILSESSFKILTNYLIFIYLRLSGGNEITNTSIKTHQTSYKIQNVSLDIQKSMKEIFDISINDIELNYLTNAIGKLNYKNNTYQNNDSIGIQFLTRKLIELISNDLSIPLYLDYNLFESLSLHLERMEGNKYNDIIEFPEVNSIVQSNERIFLSVSSYAYLLKEYFNREINKIEISYIVVYIVASIDRIINIESKNIRVLLVCNAGIGTSQLLGNNLDKIFNLIIKDSITSHQISNYNLEEIDLIISTVNLANIKKDFIKVSPLISEKDYRIISEKIKEISERKIYELKELSSSKAINSNKKFINTPEGEGIEYFLTNQTIDLDVKAKDWRDSIKKASQVLIDKAYISEKYVDDMIKNIEDYGPYVVISEGFALPHAQISEHVYKTSFSLIRLENPINYGSYEFDPIRYVCVLAVDKNEDHLAALFELINLLSIKEFKKNLDYAISSIQVENIISEFKEKYITKN